MKERQRRHYLEQMRRCIDLSADESLPDWLRKRKARNAARIAEILGVIVRPIKCEWCRCRAVLERHHWDYSLPIQVVYLCHDCHRIADTMQLNGENE